VRDDDCTRPIERAQPTKAGEVGVFDCLSRVDEGNSAFVNMASDGTAYQAQIFKRPEAEFAPCNHISGAVN
jgi:hypothetical protein